MLLKSFYMILWQNIVRTQGCYTVVQTLFAIQYHSSFMKVTLSINKLQGYRCIHHRIIYIYIKLASTLSLASVELLFLHKWLKKNFPGTWTQTNCRFGDASVFTVCTAHSLSWFRDSNSATLQFQHPLCSHDNHWNPLDKKKNNAGILFSLISCLMGLMLLG